MSKDCFNQTEGTWTLVRMIDGQMGEINGVFKYNCAFWGNWNFDNIIIKLEQKKLYLASMNQLSKISISQIRDNYQAFETLGQGNSGSVFAYRKKDTQQQYALKIIKSNNSIKRDDAMYQIQIMKKLDHPRILRIFKYYDETFFCRDKSQRYETGLLLERGIGSLQHCFKDEKYQYDFQDIIMFIVKFIDLGAYLESRQIVHRDIKPGNIIIFDQRLQFKLADFGLSCIAYSIPHGFAGTPAYCSPGLKKFYKQGDHRKKPPTNPYKDDVYSFAITSQQVIKRRYSLEDCPKEISVLLDQMLKNDERQRPTFSHLLHHDIVQKYLKGQSAISINQNHKIIEINKIERPLQAFTKKKVIQKEFSGLNYTQKSSKKYKDSFPYSVCFGIRTICNIDNQYTLCGTQKGQVYVFNLQNKQTVKLSISFSYYIAKIVMDKVGNIWIAGGDGKVQLIKKQKLISYLKNNREIETQNKFLFSPNKQTITIQVTLPKSQIKQIISDPYQKYISQFYCEDEYHYIIGYCSGAILLQWGQNQQVKFYHIHSEPITSIVVRDNCIYSGDFNGMVKMYSLSKKIIEKTVYKFDEELMGFSVSKVENGQNIEGISCKGQIKTINLFKSSKTTFQAEIPARNIIGVSFGERHYYLLTTDGQIYFRNHFLTKIQSKGNTIQNWICLVQKNQNELIIASRQGQISFVLLQN